MASAISQLVDTVRGLMLLNIVTFGYTEVYPANQMANREKVRGCKFSKLQFPISQKYRSGRCEPVK